jgi:intein/homing endonuclease
VESNKVKLPDEGVKSVQEIYNFWDNHDRSIYSGQTIASIIVDVLDHLNIKIKGVND